MNKNNKNNYIGKLNVGDVFKNYKDLCNHLNEEPKKSNSRTAHLKRWRRSFDFTNEGHKIIIKEIFDFTKKREGNWKGGDNAVKYIDVIESLLLDLLSQQESEHILISKGKLLQVLKMVNSDYSKSKFKMNKLSKEMSIDSYEIRDFYSTSDSVLQSNLETAISRLENKSLISCSKVVTVGVVNSSISTGKREVYDKYGDVSTEFYFNDPSKTVTHRRATPQERQAIIRIEREVMLDWGYNDKHSLFLDGKRNSFYEKVKDILFNEYDIYVYYSSYEISFNEDHIQEEAEKQSYKLQDFLRELSQKELNNGVVDRLRNNAKNRSENASLKHADSNKEKHKIRMSFSYLYNFDKLLEKLVVADFK